MNNKAVCYIKANTIDEISKQQKELLYFSEKFGYTIERFFIEKTGQHTKFNEMLTYIKVNKIDKVLIQNVTILADRMVEFLEIYEKHFQPKKVFLLIPELGINADTYNGLQSNFFIQTLASYAFYKKEHKKEKEEFYLSHPNFLHDHYSSNLFNEEISTFSEKDKKEQERMKKGVRAVAFLKTIDQENSKTIPEQQEAIENFCKNQGITVINFFTNCKIKELEEYVEGELPYIHHVVFYNQNYFSSDINELYHFHKKQIKNNVSLLTVNDAFQNSLKVLLDYIDTNFLL